MAAAAGGGGGSKPCYAYAKGECFRGDRCRYWHDPSIPKPDRSKQIGEGGPCWAFAQGRCFRGDACRYSHDPNIIPKDLEHNPFRNAGAQNGPPPTAIWRQWWRRGRRRTVSLVVDRANEKTQEIDSKTINNFNEKTREKDVRAREATIHQKR